MLGCHTSPLLCPGKTCVRSFLFLLWRSLLNLHLTESTGQPRPQALGTLLSASPALGLHAHTTVPVEFVCLFLYSWVLGMKFPSSHSCSYRLSSRSPLLTSLQRTTCREHSWFSTVLASNYRQLFLASAQSTELGKEGTWP
ncbi:hypothetical protein LEMLEM_LOCUS9650 [Lemmus lemmus]